MEQCPFCGHMDLAVTGDVVEGTPVMKCRFCYGIWLTVKWEDE